MPDIIQFNSGGKEYAALPNFPICDELSIEGNVLKYSYASMDGEGFPAQKEETITLPWPAKVIGRLDELTEEQIREIWPGMTAEKDRLDKFTKGLGINGSLILQKVI